MTYWPMRRGLLYLVAIMDWATRKVLAWRVSNTMDVRCCVEALEEALSRYGRPEIFNTRPANKGVVDLCRKSSAKRGATVRFVQTQRAMRGQGQSE